MGKPLIQWTLEAASRSSFIDRIVVSTDDDAIAEAASNAGFPPPFRRPESLAGDRASVVDAVLHVLEELDEDWSYIVLLQPTSPLRLTEDIDQAIQLCHAREASAVVTVSPLPKPANFLCTMGAENSLARYDQPSDAELMMLNGSVYVIQISALVRERKFTPEGAVAMVTPYERAWDIDSLYDFMACEALAPKILAGDQAVLNAVRR
jgi:N-acylneuraminate cytidylyltransferase